MRHVRRVTATVLTVVLLVLSVPPSSEAQEKSPAALLTEALKLHEELALAVSSEVAGKLHYEIQLRIHDILELHGSSSAALRLSRGRIPGINIAAIEDFARAWELQNSVEAAALRETYVGELARDQRNAPLSEAELAETVILPRVALPDLTDALRASDDQVEDITSRKYRRADVEQGVQESVVIVLATDLADFQRGEFNSGTGFFVNDRHVVTNAHVVQKRAELRLHQVFYIAGRGFQTVARARVVAVGRTMIRDEENPNFVKVSGPDLAVLEVIGRFSRSNLSLSAEVAPTETVLLNHFPAVMMSRGREFFDLQNRILTGQEVNPTAIPAPLPAWGSITGIYETFVGIEEMITDVETTGGSSGSPIVNACGHVVGVHFLGVEEGGESANNSKFNVALTLRELVRFLDENKIVYRREVQSCGQK